MDVADLGESFAVGQRLAQPANLAGSGPAQRQQHLDQGRLAGPVGTEQTEDLARFDPKADFTHRLDVPLTKQDVLVGLGDLDELGRGWPRWLTHALPLLRNGSKSLFRQPLAA